MSQSVQITRTNIPTITSSIQFNYEYLKTVIGLLKLAQTIMGATCVGLSSYYFREYYRDADVKALFFLLMATAFLITTFFLVFSSLISISTATLLSKTIFEVIYHVAVFFLYIIASITMLVDVSQRQRSAIYDVILAASIIGLINSVLYLCSAVLAIRSYRGVSI